MHYIEESGANGGCDEQQTGGSSDAKEIEAAKDAVERSKGIGGDARTRVL